MPIVPKYPRQISKSVRIDVGPPIKRSTATVNTLSDTYTAGHYRVGRPDAFGKIIEMGKGFHYVDWKGDPDDYTYTVYQLQNADAEVVEEEFDEDGERIACYQIVVRCDTESEALKIAKGL